MADINPHNCEIISTKSVVGELTRAALWVHY